MNVQLTEKSGVRLAIEGCGHGTLHAIYASVGEACRRNGWPGIDLLIIGGDFQAVRNAYDLNCVAMPAKYREMGDFHEYYSGQRTAPYLTVFVGGNHEASNYLFELYYGGWVASNIYYMGAANVLKLGPLRIAGLSGIWKGYSYRKPHHERLPYNESDERSIYHVRELDVRKLLQIRSQIDVGISHDWPNGVEWKGDWKQLFRMKRHFEDDAKGQRLGSVAAKQVLEWLRPKWWFSAHMHCKFAAKVDHSHDGSAHQARNDIKIEPGSNVHANSNEIDLDLDEDQEDSKQGGDSNGAKGSSSNEIDLEIDDEVNDAPEASVSVSDPQPGALSTEEARAALPEAFRRPTAPEPPKHPSGITNQTTDFLALDKCLPGRHFMQLLSVSSDLDLDSMRPLKLEYDREWLAITRALALDEPIELGDPETQVPKARSQSEYQDAIDERLLWVDEHINDSNLLVPENFEVIAPVYDNGNWNLPQYSQVQEYLNPQTARFCKLLGIPNPFDISDAEIESRLAAGPKEDTDARGFGKRKRDDKFGRGRGRGGGRGRGRGRGGGRGRFNGL